LFCLDIWYDDLDMNIDTIMLMGPSGSGKTTQAALLKEYLKTINPDRHILHVETGSRFREFIENEGYTNELMKKIIGKGILAPDFITEWLFVNDLVNDLREDTLLILDGFPRTTSQIMTLDSALAYYGRNSVYALNISLDAEGIKNRLLLRGRADDQNTEAIENRIDWYEKTVRPTIEHLRAQPQYHVFDIDGGVSIEEVKAQIIKALETDISK